MWYGCVRTTCATYPSFRIPCDEPRQTVLMRMVVFVDTSGVGVGMAVLGAIVVGVLVLVLGVFVVMVVVRMAVRMIVFRPIGVRMRMGVIASTHGAANSRSRAHHPASAPDGAAPVLWAQDRRRLGNTTRGMTERVTVPLEHHATCSS
jgi:hypothetical protein